MLIEFLSLLPLALLIFWLIVFNKKILFWIWLWQLKEYHVGRFLAHFSTEKGRELILSPVFAIKISLLIFLALISYFFQTEDQYFSSLPFTILISAIVLISALYFIEGLKTLVDIYKHQLKIPVLTQKTILIIAIAALFEIFFLPFILGYFFLSFLALDVFSPLITTLFVGIVQPFSNFWRKKIIRRATEKRAQFGNLIVIGITGSYGKTSVKEILANILSSKFRVLKTKEHQNSEVGISQCILNDLNSDHQIFVVEMGAYGRGGIKMLVDISKPKIGILTGINEQHMATFGSQENITKTKFELIKALPENGVAIFNGDNEIIRIYAKSQNKNIKLVFCSAKGKADYWAEEIRVQTSNISFKAFSKDGDFADFKVNLLGSQNVVNILMAVAAARELGMNLEDIARACDTLEQKQGAIQLKKGINGLNIIDSTYSANPEGVMADLDYLNVWPKKKIIIMPALIELGRASGAIHKKIGEKIMKICDFAIITSKDYFKEISSVNPQKILLIENPREIVEKIKEIANEGDAILLEGRLEKKIINELIE